MKLFLSSGEVITASPQFSLLKNLKNKGIHIIAPCGGEGQGVCGRCKVIVKKGKYRTRLLDKLSKKERSEGYVVSCQTHLKGDLYIEIPRSSLLETEGVIAGEISKNLNKIFNFSTIDISPLTNEIYLELPEPSLADNISDLERVKRGLSEIGQRNINVPYRLMRDLSRNLRYGNWKVTVALMDTGYTQEVLRISPGKRDHKNGKYGLAIDVGTTTVVIYLVNLIDGKFVDVATTYNYQIIYGEDVISRIVYATDQGGLKELNEAIINDINSILEPLKKKYALSEESIESIVISGNTAMTHLFLGLNPAPIIKEPYIPTASIFPITSAGRLGINASPDAPLYTLPCVASYVGGDVVAGVLATKIHKKQEISAFIDIGTNGELVVGNSEWLLAVACSAGPCFEGGGLAHGMRATAGAIDSVKINLDTLEPEITTIGQGSPEGICGSGIIDAIAEMYLKGVITSNGKLRADASSTHIKTTAEGLEFVLYGEKDNEITITEPDIDNILRAKAAIYAGFAVLLTETGLSFNEISKIYIAGGFGRYLNVEKAIAIGMFPDQPKNKFMYLENTSILGAYLCLISSKLREEAEAISSMMTYVELSNSDKFMDEYIAGLFLPHTNLSLFPTVKNMLDPNIQRGKSI